MPGRAGRLTPLEDRLRGAATAGVLLVASDYDGTLAPIVDDPARAFPDAPALRALVELSGLPDTRVALISGRSRAELQRLAGRPAGVALIGGHGAEFGPAVGSGDGPDDDGALGAAVAALRVIADGFAGAEVEPKPTGVAFHYRNVDPARVAAALALVVEGPARDSRLISREGKKVVELSTSSVNKGDALARLRDESGAGVTVFIGDDVTDEDGFAALLASDVGIKVGAGETAAEFRLEAQAEVAAVLERLLGLRQDAA
jgi:trehalose 6-phosphate phosphatase